MFSNSESFALSESPCDKLQTNFSYAKNVKRFAVEQSELEIECQSIVNENDFFATKSCCITLFAECDPTWCFKSTETMNNFFLT